MAIFTRKMTIFTFAYLLPSVSVKAATIRLASVKIGLFDQCLTWLKDNTCCVKVILFATDEFLQK